MNERLKKLRARLTEKRARLVELTEQGKGRADAYIEAGYKAKNRQHAAINAYQILTKDNKVQAYKDALRAESERGAKISRGVQLQKLDQAYKIAESAGNPAAMVAATREQNEMLGFHRESAPNPEREQARAAIKEEEEHAARLFLEQQEAKRTRESWKFGQKAG